jgi:acetoin utilization deacetylase AcuC-like enzyme
MSQVRPPGHHAGVRQAMGFCLHNNAAVAALAAQVSGAKKVLIVDWVMYSRCFAIMLLMRPYS